MLGITYVPPAPELAAELMQSMMDMLNEPDSAQNPLVIGALVSFAFVFVHPFMDGNGRLSRFLFHKAVCQSEVLKQGLVLPISVAMNLALMVRLCLQNGGNFSNGKRKGFLNKGYSAEILEVVESVATKVLTGRTDEEEDDDIAHLPPYRA